MSYFVVVTFDIANGRFEDYEGDYKDFVVLALKRTLQLGKARTVRLPTTNTAGEFNGQSAGTVRDCLCDQTQQCFIRRCLRGEIFVSVGENWAWGHRQP